MNAGHAARTSSRSQPGSVEKLTGINCGVVETGAGTAATVGGGATGVATSGAGRTSCLSGGNGVVLHADSESATAPIEISKLKRVNDMGNDMWLLMVEALLALFLFVFIVWWTMYAGRRQPPRPEQSSPAPSSPEPPSRESSPQPDGRTPGPDDKIGPG
jgi:heme A synthase